MKRSPAIALMATLVLAGTLGQGAMAASSKLSTSSKRVSAAVATPASGVAHGSIGKTPPSANAASRIRALGLEDDGAPGSDDSGGGLALHSSIAHGSIGTAPPAANAATSIRALGLDD